MEKKMGECRKNGYETFSQEQNFDFAKRSSIGIGGKAKTAFSPQSIAECVALLQKLQSQKRPYCVLGNLTNVLPPDEDTDKVIILVP
jgi:UDP-N-acetylenolpyruvoylglucosamine reductase